MPRKQRDDNRKRPAEDESRVGKESTMTASKRRKTAQLKSTKKVNKGKGRATDSGPVVAGPRASILILPDEILLSIIEYMNPTAKVLCGLGKTCKRLNNLVSMDLLWRPIVATMYKPYAVFITSASSSSAAPPTCFGPAPKTGCRQFLADLARSVFCFRCGDRAETSANVGQIDPDEMADKFQRRYCRVCQQSVLINKTNAKNQYLVTDKQLSTVRFIKKPWYGKGSYLYLRSTIESLSMERWDTKENLNQEKARRDPWFSYCQRPYIVDSMGGRYRAQLGRELTDDFLFDEEDSDFVGDEAGESDESEWTDDEEWDEFAISLLAYSLLRQVQGLLQDM
ncbi:hypothetical protein BC937DRAFT_94494 [Endogone sp. FLAS-F59071]|nr:hypothetical protein BC937DRAFT_94494 [Endogone sp. FLAS-F59071]|eukprot:RUS13995.1 hypothetical protein BC937DRAFT_94494 [Endogone sp. FLAS-F59071]